MNRSYRTIFNAALGAWVAAPETARAHGKGRKLKACAAAVAAAFAWNAYALPTGGQVVAGSGAIDQSGNTMTITQTSQNMAVNWASFSIDKPETVNTVQPNSSAIALFRVLGADPSRIDGTFNANGQVFLLNPNGVLFGKNAQVNVGGLVATTLGLSDADFMAGKYRFTGSAGSVVNEGSITAADGGYVALFGGQVSNRGTLVAKLGNVTLAAGSDVTLDFAGDSLISVKVNQGALNALAENKQLIQADGGTVLLTAKAADRLIQAVVNNEGVIEARSVDNRSGTIRLMGDMENGVVKVGGTLDASAPATGNGGFVETSAAHVKVADSARVTTKAAHGLTGSWLIDPVDFTVAASGGDITGAALSALLGSNHITLYASTGTNDATHLYGTTAGNGDIFINDNVSWSTAFKLTLHADRNIAINATVDAGSTGGVALEYGQGAVAAGNTATYSFGLNGKINLGAGSSFSTKLGSNGVVTNWTIITGLGAEGSTTGTDLQGMNGNRSGHYVLGADIDASLTGVWDGGAGFTPIGDGANRFSGAFDGLGHTIDGLMILRAGAYQGLFGVVDSGARIANVALTDANVTGGTLVGALAGQNLGTIVNSRASGSVTGDGAVGGLVGRNNGTIGGSDASATVAGQYSVGGLAGENYGTISASHATGDVTGSGFGQHEIGGLVGLNHQGTISDSYAEGGVSSNVGQSIGGLVGENFQGTISNSYATGAVSSNAGQGIGGLVGWNNSGSILASYAYGTVTGDYEVGGLVGRNDNNYRLACSVSDSYATGAVSGSTYVGGLAGLNAMPVSNSYATGAITLLPGGTYAGSLFGRNIQDESDIVNSRYNIDTATINGAKSVAAYGMYDTQFLDWLTHGKSLSIGNYFSHDASGNYLVSNTQNLKDILGFADAAAAYRFLLTANLDLSALPGWYIPILAGSFDGGGHVLSNLYVNKPAESNLGFVGSLASSGSVLNLGLVNVSVTGDQFVGGLVGNNDSGLIANSYATGTVRGNRYVGGLAGVNYGFVADSYANVAVTGSEHVGGLFGDNLGNGYIISSRYDIDTATINGSKQVGPYGIYDAQFQDWLAHGKSLSIGNYFSRDASGNYLVSSTQNLKDILGFADDAAAYRFLLTANLDLSVLSGWYIPILAGSFDGGGHVLSNLNLNDPNRSNLGFVGVLTGSITNLGLANVNVSGENYVGGLAGTNNFGQIGNSYATGAVSGTYGVGGLVGKNDYGAISNSHAAVSVDGTYVGTYVGGLVGYNRNGSIDRSYATGTVTGESGVGGLAGSNGTSYGSSRIGTIRNSYATGAVSGGTVDIGGLVGLNDGGTIDKSYAVGAVAVSGATSTGGLVGDNFGTVTASFWDTSTSGQSAGIGGGTATGATGLATGSLKTAATFGNAGWDVSAGGSSSSVWVISNGTAYPQLRAAAPPPDTSGSQPPVPPTVRPIQSTPTYLAALNSIQSGLQFPGVQRPQTGGGPAAQGGGNGSSSGGTLPGGGGNAGVPPLGGGGGIPLWHFDHAQVFGGGIRLPEGLTALGTD